METKIREYFNISLVGPSSSGKSSLIEQYYYILVLLKVTLGQVSIIKKKLTTYIILNEEPYFGLKYSEQTSKKPEERNF